MAVEIKHKFQSAKADSADASLIRPSNWNDTHDITMATARIMGRYSAGDGAVQEISLGTGLSFSGSSIALSAALQQMSALPPTDGNFIVGNGTAWVVETASVARASLGLGTSATMASEEFVGADKTVVAGNGLTGGGELITSPTVTLGTPTTLTANTENIVSTTSHAHKVDWNGGVASIDAGAIGSFVFASYSDTAAYGATVPGSSLFPGATNSGANDARSTALSGTWRSLGYKNSIAGLFSLYMRIS